MLYTRGGVGVSALEGGPYLLRVPPSPHPSPHPSPTIVQSTIATERIGRGLKVMLKVRGSAFNAGNTQMTL